MLHFWYHCYVAEYAILLLHNLIYHNFGIQTTITPSIMLVTEPSQLKPNRIDKEIMDVILNLILALKNNLHLDFYKRKLFVSPFSSNYHNSLLKRTIHTAYKASNKV